VSDGASRALRLVAQVDALWDHGAPGRGLVVAIEEEGVVYFRVAALKLQCEGCGASVPQSRSRISREARARWLTHHAGCSSAR
jgi:hypothetical protein